MTGSTMTQKQQQQAQSDATNAIQQPQKQKLRAKARWSILRNAILNSAKQQQHQQQQTTDEASIHRFPGYQLLTRRQTVNDTTCSPPITSATTTTTTTENAVAAVDSTTIVVPEEAFLLQNYFAYQHILCSDYTNKKDDNDTTFNMEQIAEELESIIGAIMVCWSSASRYMSEAGPKNNNITNAAGSTATNNSVSSNEWPTVFQVTLEGSNWDTAFKDDNSNGIKDTLLKDLKKRCSGLGVQLTWQNDDAVQETKQPSSSLLSLSSSITLLIRPETSPSSMTMQNYACCYYPLPVTQVENEDSNDKSQGTEPLPPLASPSKETNTSTHELRLWTREPVASTTRPLSLEELVSHRRTGVDNTGNICVWDSERTMAYLLHRPDTLKSLLLSSSSSSTLTTPQNDCNRTSGRKIDSILELGTGMAGLAALSLGLRLAQLQQQKLSQDQQQQEHKVAQVSNDNNTRPRQPPPKIVITLTDGHIDGVRNNRINHQLNCAYYQHQQHHSSNPQNSNWYSDYLEVEARVLLWTTDYHPSNIDQENDTMMTTSITKVQTYDICLISDCTHFQTFHAALAITVLRHLNVGGRAIFCQPLRGNSLDNFVALLTCCFPDNKEDDDALSSFVTIRWWTHDVLQEQHEHALATNNRSQKNEKFYDPNIHEPKILIVTKQRDMTSEESAQLVAHQVKRDEDKKKKKEEEKKTP